MSYPKYITPPMTGLTWSSGGGTLQSIYEGMLSYQTDAQAYATAIGAKLINGATDTTLGLKFSGINPTDAAQPWIVQWNTGGPWAFAGIAIDQQVGATLAVIGTPSTQYPGTWNEQPSGLWLFVPSPVVVAVPTPAPSNSAADLAGWEAAMNMPTVTLNDVMKALAAIGTAVGAKAPN